MDIALTIGQNVQRLRASRGLTQKEFAERVGVSVHTIISIEHKKATSFDVVERIAHAFELEPADLLTNEPATRKPLMDAIDVESVTEDDFKSLSPFKRAFYQSMAVKLDKLYDEPLDEVYNNFKARLLNDIDLIDPTSMTAVEVKQAAVRVVRDAVSAQ